MRSKEIEIIEIDQLLKNGLAVSPTIGNTNYYFYYFLFEAYFRLHVPLMTAMSRHRQNSVLI